MLVATSLGSRTLVTSLGYIMATCDLTWVYGHSRLHLGILWPVVTSLVYMATRLSSYTDLFVTPDDPNFKTCFHVA